MVAGILAYTNDEDAWNAYTVPAAAGMVVSAGMEGHGQQQQQQQQQCC
jgi:hypothetical protein